MNNALIQCPACRAWLMEGPFNQPDLAPCPACGVRLQTQIFPALFRKISVGQAAETVMIEGESSCFYHPQKKAVLPCDGCGRFLCALCDCLLNGQHFCPTCLEAGKTKGKIKSLDNERKLYDNIALSLAISTLILYFLFFYLSIFPALTTLYVAIRYWNTPSSIIRRTKIRFIIAIILALLEIIAWALKITYLTTRHSIHG